MNLQVQQGLFFVIYNRIYQLTGVQLCDIAISWALSTKYWYASLEVILWCWSLQTEWVDEQYCREKIKIGDIIKGMNLGMLSAKEKGYNPSKYKAQNDINIALHT